MPYKIIHTLCEQRTEASESAQSLLRADMAMSSRGSLGLRFFLLPDISMRIF